VDADTKKDAQKRWSGLAGAQLKKKKSPIPFPKNCRGKQGRGEKGLSKGRSRKPKIRIKRQPKPRPRHPRARDMQKGKPRFFSKKCKPKKKKKRATDQIRNRERTGEACQNGPRDRRHRGPKTRKENSPKTSSQKREAEQRQGNHQARAPSAGSPGKVVSKKKVVNCRKKKNMKGRWKGRTQMSRQQKDTDQKIEGVRVRQTARSHLVE